MQTSAHSNSKCRGMTGFSVSLCSMIQRVQGSVMLSMSVMLVTITPSSITSVTDKSNKQQLSNCPNTFLFWNIWDRCSLSLSGFWPVRSGIGMTITVMTRAFERLWNMGVGYAKIMWKDSLFLCGISYILGLLGPRALLWYPQFRPVSSPPFDVYKVNFNFSNQKNVKLLIQLFRVCALWTPLTIVSV